MMSPTPAQVEAAKAESRARFGHARLVRCATGEPINLVAAVAAFGLAEADKHEAARARQAIDARSALLAERCLFPSMDELAEIREDWPAVDVKIEEQFMLAMGFGGQEPMTRELAVSTAPKGFAPPAELAKRVAEAREAADGAKLWSIIGPASGLAAIVRAPIADVWTAGCIAIEEGQKAGKVLSAIVPFIRDHLVWCAQPIDVHLDERPGRARDLLTAWTEMGGAAASGSHSFF